MTQHFFEQKYAQFWQEYDAVIQRVQKQGARRKKANTEADKVAELPQMYQSICQQYALAQQRLYSRQLIDRLHQRVLLGHQLLYRAPKLRLNQILLFVWRDFPQSVRQHIRLVWIATLLFYLPAFTLGVACYQSETLIYSVMPSQAVSQMEEMYQPSRAKKGKLGRTDAREGDTDIQMWGFYIWNNTSIGLRNFALGLLFGLGTIASLLFNGISIGAVAGHLTKIGYGSTFWPFVVTHSALELTAIVISGAAGLRLAMAILAPKDLSRIDALKLAGKEGLQLALGSALMFVLAAFVEAFWSPLPLPPIYKFSIAALLWLAVLGYLTFAGRSGDARKVYGY